MKIKKSVSGSKRLFLAGIVILVLLVQGCMTTNYNSRNWRRTPPSTGRNRCGCLMQLPEQLINRHDGYSYKA